MTASAITTTTARLRPVLPPRDTRPRTPWFEGAVRPERKGVYERQVRLAPFSYWDGRYWGMSSQSAETAWLNRAQASLHQGTRWRGLALEEQATS